MTGVGFVGLWFAGSSEHDGLTERQFMQTNGGATVWLFSATSSSASSFFSPSLSCCRTRGHSHPRTKSASLDRVVSHYHRAHSGEHDLADRTRNYADHDDAIPIPLDRHTGDR